MVSCRTEAEQCFERVRVPSDGDHGSWRAFCFGDQAADEPQRQPTMPVLMAIDQVHIATLCTPAVLLRSILSFSCCILQVWRFLDESAQMHLRL